MTRAEFINTVDSWPDLLDFCYTHNCPVYDDIHIAEERDRIVLNNIREWTYGMTWQDILDLICDIPTSGDVFSYDEYGQWHDITEDFPEWKDKVILWGNQTGFWASEPTPDTDPDPDPDPDTPLTLLFS